MAVCDGKGGQAKLYRNGELVGEGRCMAISNTAETIFVGKGEEEVKDGPFNLNTFNGLIDEIEVFDTLLTEAEIKAKKAENDADLTIPASRFADQRLRPLFHGMPGANWTNESHGMLYSDGRYHVFFQKNGNGPYMSRLHWGHISSENLYDWREENIAIMPGDPYDIKGCWSGSVFTDPTIGGGKPTALYTAVDYVRAVIAQATADDEGLIKWSKAQGNPVINGRPNGLSDDFRDPYFFRNGEKAYIIVGSSKNGVGTTTLHEYNSLSGSWSNDGRTFFSGSDKESAGTFWEMPNITKMDNGKWLFTCTPLGTTTGVHTLYWTGDIAADGTFVPDSYSAKPRSLELISKDGFGLLSPTIYTHNGKTLMLGIVPDKLAGMDNYNLGWAHTYSLPREISLGADGSLVQKPFEGLRELRTDKLHSQIENGTLDGTRVFEGVYGPRVEVSATFAVGNSEFGCRLFKNSAGAVEVSYNPVNNQLTVDMTKVNKLSNDKGRYDGVYQCYLPERPAAGSDLTLDVFADGSILDIFVNNRWATSIRVFPTDSDANGVELFSEGPTEVKQADAWILSSDAHPAGVDSISAEFAGSKTRYDLLGRVVADPEPGQITIVNGKKEIYRR